MQDITTRIKTMFFHITLSLFMFLAIEAIVIKLTSEVFESFNIEGTLNNILLSFIGVITFYLIVLLLRQLDSIEEYAFDFKQKLVGSKLLKDTSNIVELNYKDAIVIKHKSARKEIPVVERKYIFNSSLEENLYYNSKINGYSKTLDSVLINRYKVHKLLLPFRLQKPEEVLQAILTYKIEIKDFEKYKDKIDHEKELEKYLFGKGSK